MEKRYCSHCGGPLSPSLSFCPHCGDTHTDEMWGLSKTNDLPQALLPYLFSIVRSRLYWGLLLFSVIPILLATFHFNIIAGMMIYFSLFWYFIFSRVASTKFSLRNLFADGFVYLFTGTVGVFLAILGESAGMNLGANQYLQSRFLLVSIVGFTVFVGIIEEFAKLLIVLLLAGKDAKQGHIHHPIHYMLLGVLSGLGFSAVENINYVLHGVALDMAHKSLALGTTTALMRALYTPFLHGIWTGTAGYMVGLALRDRKKRYSYLLGGLILVAFFHGTYDASIGVSPFIGLLDIAISFFVFMALALNSKRSHTTI